MRLKFFGHRSHWNRVPLGVLMARPLAGSRSLFFDVRFLGPLELSFGGGEPSKPSRPVSMLSGRPDRGWNVVDVKLSLE